MLIEINGFWINPDHIIRLYKDSTGEVIVMMAEGLNIRTESRSYSDVSGLINRSCVNRRVK
jgi:hypothetical protein